MKKKLMEEIEKAILCGYNTFYSGMALGFDLICVEILIEMKEKYNDIKIIGAIPCKNQDALWPKEQRERYIACLSKLDSIRCIFDEYNGRECMIERNKYMVDNSSLMIALYNGLPGGTWSTINYAKKRGLKVVIINP